MSGKEGFHGYTVTERVKVGGTELLLCENPEGEPSKPYVVWLGEPRGTEPPYFFRVRLAALSFLYSSAAMYIKSLRERGEGG